MAFRVRYMVAVEYLPPGIGPMGGTGAASPGMAPTGVGFSLALFNQAGGQTSPTFLAADITNLTNAMATDIAAQMTTNIARIAGFATGGS
jgi:hypothetical protein